MTTLFPVAAGKTLLRPFRLDDGAAKARLDSDPDIRKHLGGPSRLEDDIAAFNRLGYGLVAIVDPATDRIVGCAKLQRPEWKEGLGLELVVAVAAEARRKGLGLDVAQRLIMIGCGPLQQKEIVGRVALTNTASLNLVQKLGMTKADEREDPIDGVQHIYVVSCAKRAG